MARGYLDRNPDMAEVFLVKLLKIDPNHVEALQLLGLCKRQMSEFDEALKVFEKALTIEPSPENYGNISLAYSSLKQHDKAIEALNKAIELDPQQPLFYSNLAIQYHAIKDYPKAFECMNKALELDSNRGVLWNNLGCLHNEVGEFEKSLPCFEKAIKLDPGSPSNHVNLGLTYHILGDWQNGFREQEWRFFHFPDFLPYRSAYNMKKLWDGRASLQGKRLLVHGEQGAGDIIMFLRFAKNFKELGAHVTYNVPESLQEVARRVQGIDEVVSRDIFKGESLPAYDYQISSMSAPYLLGLTDIDGHAYVRQVDNAGIEFYEQHKNTFNVGIVWGGNPKQPENATRSIPLKEFQPLFAVPDVRLFSLQVEPAARAERAGMGDNLPDLMLDVKDFFDTGKVITGLDLVIGCQTAVTHLAGALGCPVWVLLNKEPDWRWGLEGEGTIWYDSMRLFRQKEMGNWAEVMARVAERLAQQKKRAGSTSGS